MSETKEEIVKRETDRYEKVLSARMTGSNPGTHDSDMSSIYTDIVVLRSSINELTRSLSSSLHDEQVISIQSELHSVLDKLIFESFAVLLEKRGRIIADQSQRDSVTNLLNRTAFDRHFNEEVERARRYNRRLSLILFDIDNFKAVNDHYGHPAGDDLLRQIAVILQSSLRQTDTVFRFGGDEFAAVCPETPGKALMYILDRIEKNISIWNETSNLPCFPGISSGTATYPMDGDEPDCLIRIADSRLYERKRNHHLV